MKKKKKKKKKKRKRKKKKKNKKKNKSYLMKLQKAISISLIDYIIFHININNNIIIS